MGRITLTEEQKRIAESIRSGQGASTQQAPSAYRGGRITLNQKQIQIASKYGLPNPDYGKNAQSTQTTVDDPLHKQYAAFMAYQNAVREAELAKIEPGAALKGRASGQKKTENAGAETDGKVSEQEYEALDKEYLLRVRKESFGYSCLTNQKNYYLENYPGIIVEKGSVDEVISMLVKGELL